MPPTTERSGFFVPLSSPARYRTGSKSNAAGSFAQVSVLQTARKCHPSPLIQSLLACSSPGEIPPADQSCSNNAWIVCATILAVISARRVAQWVLSSVCICCAVLIGWRALAGPLDSPIHLHSPLNVEGFFGLSAILFWLIRAKTNTTCARLERRLDRFDLLASVSVAAIVACAFWRAGSYYFLSDDFILVKYALAPMFRDIFRTAGGDGFYRPLPYVSMALTAVWAGMNPTYWHAAAIALHAVNSMLVYLLAVSLRLSRYAAWFAAALFAVHASRPETVVWIAARYDLLAALFVLLGLVFFIRGWDFAGWRALLYRSASLLAMVLAFLSKESAYTFPLLLLLLAAWKGDWKTRRSRFAVLPFFGVAAAFLVWRWILFGGAGGYLSPAGQPEVLSLGIVSTLKALGLRLPTVLFFPVNWSHEPGLPLGVTMIFYLAALLWLWRAQVPQRALLLALGFLLALALPPLSQLLIGADLQKSRILYLPSVGFCLLLAIAVEQHKAKWIVSIAILAFNLAALFHNLAAWDDASKKARAACSVATGCAQRRGGRMAVLGLPHSLRGVYFFANGFPQCVEMQSGVEAAKVELRETASPVDATQYSCILDWDGGVEQLSVR